MTPEKGKGMVVAVLCPTKEPREFGQRAPNVRTIPGHDSTIISSSMKAVKRADIPLLRFTASRCHGGEPKSTRGDSSLFQCAPLRSRRSTRCNAFRPADALYLIEQESERRRRPFEDPGEERSVTPKRADQIVITPIPTCEGTPRSLRAARGSPPSSSATMSGRWVVDAARPGPSADSSDGRRTGGIREGCP